MSVDAVKDEIIDSLDKLLLPLVIATCTIVVANLQHASADGYLPAHDDALRHAPDIVLLALDCRIVEVVGRHLERGEHEDGLLHLLDAEPRNSQNLSLVSHLVGQQLHVPVVDLDAVLPNRELDLVYDHVSRRLDAEYLRCLHDMVSASLPVVDAGCSHHLGQAIPLYRQVIALFTATVLLGNDGALDGRIALDYNVGQAALQPLHHEVELVSARLAWLDVDLIMAHFAHVLLLYLQFAGLEDRLNDRV